VAGVLGSLVAGRREDRLMAPADRLVSLRDGAVTLRVLGAGRGAPVVYLHSFHEVEPWSPFLDRLAERFTVLAPVHPGAPGSTGVETLDGIHDLTLVYDELLDALGAEAPALVGHGFGGMVAAEIAAVFRRRPAKVVLVSPLGLWLDATPNADLLILPVEELLTTLWADPASSVAQAWASSPDADPDNVPALAASLQRRSAMAKFVWPIPDRGLRTRLHRILAPTLLLWGERDRANPLPYAEAWQRSVKGAALRLLPGGHMVLHEHPDAAADAVMEFLA
jgi:pimeloyl-ACP methyl ester carboxylesterase